jgi:transcriptional regulator GlxA family with amidase domain
MKTIIGTAILLAASAAFAGGPGHCYDPSTRAGYVCASATCAGNHAVAQDGGSCRACGQKLSAVKDLTHVAVVLYDGVDLLDVTGPADVFANAGGFYVYTMSQHGNAVRSGGLDVEPAFDIKHCPWPDILVVSGKGGTEVLRNWVDLVGKDADHVLKTGGVSSGIDGALAIVAKMKGDESARRAARAIEYEGWLAQSGGQKLAN